MKSAVLARASGAARVVGFSIWHLREKTARPFYTDAPDRRRRRVTPRRDAHVIGKNLGFCAALGIEDDRDQLSDRGSRVGGALASVRATLGGDGRSRCSTRARRGRTSDGRRSASARSRRFCAMCAGCRRSCCGDRGRRRSPQRGRRRVGAAPRASRRRRASPICSRSSRARTLMVSGDTGPLHIAAAVGTPTCRLFGPTDPQRNGPWAPDDRAVSRYASCRCHYLRRCHERVVVPARYRGRGSQLPRCSSGLQRMTLLARIARFRVHARVRLRRARALARAADARDACDRRRRRARRRGDPDLGGRPSREGPRGHDVRALRVHAHPLYLGSSIMGLGLAIASASCDRGGADCRLSARHADRGDPQRGGVSDREVRRGVSGVSRRRRERRPARFSSARAMRNREYRALIGLLLVLAASRGKRGSLRWWRRCAGLPLEWSRYNRCFGGTVGGPAVASRGG